jgi:hypothetical protein
VVETAKLRLKLYSQIRSTRQTSGDLVDFCARLARDKHTEEAIKNIEFYEDIWRTLSIVEGKLEKKMKEAALWVI